MSPNDRAAGHGAPRRGARARLIRRWLPRAVLFFALATMTAGCNSTWTQNLGLRNPLTTQAQLIAHLWQGAWIAAIVVGVLVWGAILWAVIFYRKRSDAIPHQVRYNLPIEILYTVVPFIMVGVLFYFTARDENRIDRAVRRTPTWSSTSRASSGAGSSSTRSTRCKNSANGVTEVGYMWNANSADGNENAAAAAGDPRPRDGPVQPDL